MLLYKKVTLKYKLNCNLKMQFLPISGGVCKKNWSITKSMSFSRNFTLRLLLRDKTQNIKTYGPYVTVMNN